MAETSTTALCGLADIPDGGSTVVESGGRAIALFRVGDEVFALANACPHKGGPLGEAIVSAARHEAICPWHRFRFDLRTGLCVTNEKLASRRYPVSVREGAVYLDS